MNGERSEIHVGEIDGVRAVWADAPGPLTVGLMFGVGHANETLPTTGITHLVEHLALFGIAQPGDHTNGSVDASRTLLHTTGKAEDVADFLDAVTRRIHDLPLDRLDAERDVLRAEYASRRLNGFDELMVWRYGMTGFGLAGVGDPPALHAWTAEQVQEWARARMTRANAALFFSRRPPQGLRLHLPDDDGPAPTRPDPTGTVLPWLPAWVARDAPGASLVSVVARDDVSSLLMEVYRTRIVHRLRIEQAAAYSPNVSLDAADGRHSFLTVATDLLPERAEQSARELVGVLRELAGEPGTTSQLAEDDLEAARATLRRAYDEPQRVVGEAVSQAWSLLTGVPVVSVAQRQAALQAVSVADVAQRARDALGQAVAMMPPAAGAALPWGEAPPSSREILRGEGAAPLDPASDSRLIVTPDAAGLRSWEEGWVTVPRAHTVAILAWPDGRRDLICDEGNRLVVEPNKWIGGTDLVARIDALWPSDVVVAMPPRAPEAIPVAPPPAKPARLPLRVRLTRLSTRTEMLIGVGLAVIAVAFCLAVLSVRPKATGIPVLLSLAGIRGLGWWNARRKARTRAERGVVDLPDRE